MVPVFVLLMGMVALVLTLARLVFGVPFRGGMWFFVTVSALCVLTGISIGTLGVEVVYPEVPSLLAFTMVLVGVSIWRFRRELGCGPRGGRSLPGVVIASRNEDDDHVHVKDGLHLSLSS